MTKNNRMSNESIECPLCMEPMDFDDVDFYPCPCRYQICRFCWDKIINEENGLCPACRKPYNSEHPASYKPRTEEEIKNKIKHSKKVCTKKIKPAPEGKEYLSEYRVLQKNLIFVVGLPMRMADEVELLKGSEYFGKCGKVYKIVINQNQTFPGPQGTPCLSAYVTYHRNEDALKTLVDLKKLEIDGRAVKLSLGTTKYCSQFLRNRRCTKQDCMYLHEMGDPAASFTKDDMSNGKHTEYENQLIQEFFENQKTAILSPNTVINGLFVSIVSTEQEKSTQRKSSLSSQTTTCVSCIPTTLVSASSTSSIKGQRTGFTPIGTDPNDDSKIYSISSDTCHSKSSTMKCTTSELCCNSNKDTLSLGPDSLNTALVQCDFFSTSPVSSDLQFIQQQNPLENLSVSSSHSLLDSFYYLNSQVSGNGNNNGTSNTSSGTCQPQYDHHINQQSNNNNNSNTLSNYSQTPYNNDIDFTRSFGSDKSVEQKFKDTADIDFDPINISRLGLAELIATENRQKMTPYLPQVFVPSQRNMPRQSVNEFMMQSSDVFYSNSNNNNTGNNSNNNLSHRVSSQSSYIQDKQTAIDGRIGQHMSSGIIGNSSNTASVTVAPISSGFPSPPPGFEVTHNNGCIGEQSSGDMMNMIMGGHSNVDLYNRYQNQHSVPEIPMAMSHHSAHYTNQYSMSSVNNYHNDFSGFSNGGPGITMGYNDLTTSPHQSHPPWKNTAQSVFCDGGQLAQTEMILPSHTSNIRSSAAPTTIGYNRSHSMNENIGIRNSEWNGFASFNSTNDSHMNSVHDSNNFSLSMRGQSVSGGGAGVLQCGAMTTNVNINDAPHIHAHRQQTSHSVNH